MSKFDLSSVLPCNTSRDCITYLESSAYSSVLDGFFSSFCEVLSDAKRSYPSNSFPYTSVIDYNEDYSASADPLQHILLRDVYTFFHYDRKKTLGFFDKVFQKTFPHFSFSEIFASSVADAHNIINLPFGNAIYKLLNLIPLLTRLEDIRHILNMPIYITSGFRTPKLNKLVKGVNDSRHQHFRALDIRCDDMDSLYELCRSDIFRYVYRGNGYIHIDI
ncbi:peptidase [Sigmofec virus UA08Rod_4626]|uniref:Peptidase n=1 Tax=Sigmofec virus UA08Rod_4626 TaxID=2929405 RepID=A0A976N1C6_9VIRU|nr:peptidase [Sigmofec virus UA08Rod_4626]